MILVIDNYDSFTYNLVQYLGELGAEVEVRRNDATSIGEIVSLAPAGILISPGPGRPEDAGISLEILERVSERVPDLRRVLGASEHRSALRRLDRPRRPPDARANIVDRTPKRRGFRGASKSVDGNAVPFADRRS